MVLNVSYFSRPNQIKNFPNHFITRDICAWNSFMSINMTAQKFQIFINDDNVWLGPEAKTYHFKNFNSRRKRSTFSESCCYFACCCVKVNGVCNRGKDSSEWTTAEFEPSYFIKKRGVSKEDLKLWKEDFNELMRSNTGRQLFHYSQAWNPRIGIAAWPTWICPQFQRYHYHLVMFIFTIKPTAQSAIEKSNSSGFLP